MGHDLPHPMFDEPDPLSAEEQRRIDEYNKKKRRYVEEEKILKEAERIKQVRKEREEHREEVSRFEKEVIEPLNKNKEELKDAIVLIVDTKRGFPKGCLLPFSWEEERDVQRLDCSLMRFESQSQAAVEAHIKKWTEKKSITIDGITWIETKSIRYCLLVCTSPNAFGAL